MTDTPTAAPAVGPEPTPEEMASAREVFARQAAVDKAKLMSALPALRSLIGDAGFAPLLSAAISSRDRLTAGTPVHQHLTAIILGMTNLQTDVDRIATA